MGRRKKKVRVSVKGKAKKKDGMDVTETEAQLPSPLELAVHVLPIGPPPPEGNVPRQIGNGDNKRTRKRKESVTINSKAKKNKLTDGVPDPPESEPVVSASGIVAASTIPKGFSDLPPETVKHILSFLHGDVEGLKSARLVSKVWEQFTTPVFRKSHPEITFYAPEHLITFVKEATKRKLNLAGGFPYSMYVFDMYAIRKHSTRVFTNKFGPYVSELRLLLNLEEANIKTLEKIFLKAQDLVEGMTNLKVLKLAGDTRYVGATVNLPNQNNMRTVHLPNLRRLDMLLCPSDVLLGEMCTRFLEGARNLETLEIFFNEQPLRSDLIERILNILQNINNVKVDLLSFEINQYPVNIAPLDVIISMSAWLRIRRLEFVIGVEGLDSEANRNVQRQVDTFTRLLASQSANLESLSICAFGIKDLDIVHQLPYLQVLKQLTFNYYNTKFQNFETLLPENFPDLESITLEGYSERCNRPLLIADESFPTVHELNLQYNEKFKIITTPWDQIFPNLTTLTLNSAKTAQLEFIIKKMTNLVNLTVELESDGGDIVAVLSGLHKPKDVYLKFFKEVYQMDDFDRIFGDGAHVIELDGKEGLDKLVSFLSKEQLAYRLPGLRGMKRLKKFVLNQKFKSIEDYGAFLSFFEVNPIEKLVITKDQMSEPCQNLVLQYHSKPKEEVESVSKAEIDAEGTDDLELD